LSPDNLYKIISFWDLKFGDTPLNIA
jgi:hypothetical protein